MAIKKPAGEVLNDIKAFDEFRALMFPDGIMPSEKEIRSSILSKNHTIKDPIIANMMDNGVPEIPILENPDAVKEGYVTQDTLDFYKKVFKPEFSTKFKKGAKGIKTVLGNATKIKNSLKKNLTEYDNQNFLDINFDEVNDRLKELGTDKNKIRVAAIAPLETGVQNIGSSQRGTAKITGSKIPEGDIPTKSVLKAMLSGIGDIPDLKLRYASILSLLGYRGEDLVNIRVDRNEATGKTSGSITRPYYDVDKGTIVAPRNLRGRGKKGLPPDATPGPVFQQILTKAHAEAIEANTSAIFDGIATSDISDALKEHVFSKIKQSDIDKMGRNLSDYTDMRRVIAAVIANEFGEAGLASEIIGHTSASQVDESFDKVMQNHYVKLKDKNIDSRKAALFGFESLLAEVAEVDTSLKLGTLLKLELPTNVKVVYPKKESFSADTKPVIMPTTEAEIKVAKEIQEANDVAIIASKNAEAQASSLKSAQDLVEEQKATIEAGKNAPAVAEARLAIEQADIDLRDRVKQEKKMKSASLGSELLNDIIDDAPDSETTSQYAKDFDDSQKIAVSPDTVDPETGKKFTPAKIAMLTGAGIFFVSPAGASDLVQDIITEEAVEGSFGAVLGRVAPNLAKTAIGRASPFAATAAVLPTSDTNMGEVERAAKMQVEQKYFTDPSMTDKPIYRGDRRLPDDTGMMYDKSSLPKSDIPLKARRLETKRRDTAGPNLSSVLSGGKPDITPGFVTRPNRSQLRDETERQLKSNSFLGAT